MPQARLSSLLIINVNKDIDIDIDRVIDVFGQRSPQRLEFLLEATIQVSQQTYMAKSLHDSSYDIMIIIIIFSFHIALYTKMQSQSALQILPPGTGNLSNPHYECTFQAFLYRHITPWYDESPCRVPRGTSQKEHERVEKCPAFQFSQELCYVVPAGSAIKVSTSLVPNKL